MSAQRLKSIAKLMYEAWMSNRIQLQAATLTYYSLLLIVPICALFLGLGELFHLKSTVTELIKTYFQEQDILKYLIQFSDAALEQSRHTTFKIIGFLILLWALMEMLMLIDTGVNNLWDLKPHPSYIKRILRYIILLFVFPLLFFGSSGLSLFLYGFIEYIREKVPLLNQFSTLYIIAINLVSAFVTFLLFGFLFYFVPYCKVRIKYVLIAASIAAILHQLGQFLYFTLQFNAIKYNAIYGAFAAIPLFLLWLHLSWTLFFVGARLNFTLQKSSRKHMIE